MKNKEGGQYQFTMNSKNKVYIRCGAINRKIETDINGLEWRRSPSNSGGDNNDNDNNGITIILDTYQQPLTNRKCATIR